MNNNNNNNNNTRQKTSKLAKKPFAKKVQAQLLRPIKFREFPRSFKVALNLDQLQIYSAVVGPRTFTYGLFEFLGDVPNYSTQLYTMYKYARIHAVHVNLEIVNSGTSLVSISMAPIPDIDITAATRYDTINKRPRSVYQMLAGNSGINKAKLSHTYYSEQELGQPVLDKEHWVDAVQAVTSTSRNPQDPVIAISVGPTDQTGATVWSALITAKVTFHVEYFSPEGIA